MLRKPFSMPVRNASCRAGEPRRRPPHDERGYRAPTRPRRPPHPLEEFVAVVEQLELLQVQLHRLDVGRLERRRHDLQEAGELGGVLGGELVRAGGRVEKVAPLPVQHREDEVVVRRAHRDDGRRLPVGGVSDPRSAMRPLVSTAPPRRGVAGRGGVSRTSALRTSWPSWEAQSAITSGMNPSNALFRSLMTAVSSRSSLPRPAPSKAKPA